LAGKLLLVFSVVNFVGIGFLQYTISEKEQQIQMFSENVQECAAGNILPLSRAVSSVFINAVKEDSPYLRAFAGSVRNGLVKTVDTWLSTMSLEQLMTANGTSTIDLFPNNIFAVLNSIITSDFTSLLKDMSSFAHSFAQGIIATQELHSPFCYYDYWGYWVCYYYRSLTWGDLANGFEIFSQITEIMARRVQPLSNVPITVDPSVVGSVLTQLPSDIQGAVSNTTVWRDAGADCVTIFSRLYAQSWDFCYVKHSHDEKRPSLQCESWGAREFVHIENTCQKFYLGGQV
jgi:hypothetical protein